MRKRRKKDGRKDERKDGKGKEDAKAKSFKKGEVQEERERVERESRERERIDQHKNPIQKKHHQCDHRKLLIYFQCMYEGDPSILHTCPSSINFFSARRCSER